MMPRRPGDGLVERARRQADRLQDHGVFVPGFSGIEYPRPAPEGLKMSRAVFEAITRIAETDC